MRDRILGQLIGTPENTEIAYDALMPRKVSNLLLVSSLYDYYTIIEDGRLSEMLYTEYLDLDLRFTPSIERVSTAAEALEKLQSEPFDLVISMVRVGEMNVGEFGQAVHAIHPDLPVVLLAYSTRELSALPELGNLKGIHTFFVWLGDVSLFLAIIKYIEDWLNASHDAKVAGVRSIILLEDSVQFYSLYLPMLYKEILHQTRALTAESSNRAQRVLRMRARPKILLARTYEEGMRLYDQYKNNLLGVIVDAAVPREERMDPAAGFQIARILKDQLPELPLLVQSDSQNAEQAASLGLSFIDKNSPTLLGDLRDFMQRHLGFGDFIFLGPDDTVISRAPDLRSLEWAVRALPEEYVLSNVTRNDLLSWLMARTEFELAEAVRHIVRKDGASPGKVREELLRALRRFRQRSMSGIVAEYSSGAFEGDVGFVRIGMGSLGGKGRGLAFLNSLIKTYNLERRFDGVRIFVPPTMVLTTEIYDRFMESAGLWSYALAEISDDKITRAFLGAELPTNALEDLWNFLQWVRYPLAVRSSSLLEDASYQPFAGIYKTFMIPNNNEDPEIRLRELCDVIRMVYASTYHSDPKAYMESLPNRLEEEKMAVVIQQVVGKRHDSCVYPNIAGVARSLNFYPMPGMRPEDGVVSVALGLGKTVVEGGRCVRFCPAYPRKPIQSLTPGDHLENSQKNFLALQLRPEMLLSNIHEETSLNLVALDLKVAENHGTLAPVGSVYSPDNDAIYDGVSRPGIRLVTMAGVLKGSLFPLAEVTDFLLKVGTAASSCPVEIEFAVNLSNSASEPHQFACLQIRPLVLGAELQDVSIQKVSTRDAICISHRALGNGYIRGVQDLVYVRQENFDRSMTKKIAEEVGGINLRLREQKRPYIIIGPGRWGSVDPWLGIPVKWAQISAARCIVETGFKDMQVDPSQGSHFFHNLMSFGIGYLTVNRHSKRGDFLDVDWLDRQPAELETEHLRQIRFDQALHIVLNGRKSVGVVKKPSP